MDMIERTAPLQITRPGPRTRLCFWDPVTDRFFPLKKGEITLGKGSDCDIVLSHPTVSRRHARIRLLEDGCTVHDRGSCNGLWMNRSRVENVEVGLHDVFFLGANPLVVTTVPLPQRAPVIRGIDFLTRNQEFHGVINTASTVARTSHHILITGETGTGKEWMARHIHLGSLREKESMISVNCGALARDLLESELFGHTRGAFTGAAGSRAGLIASARGGTLFLDEIGELRPEHQAALLRFLENRTYRQVGSDRETVSDARLITATHANLPALAAAGDYREDLMYRLMEIRIHLPPLTQV